MRILRAVAVIAALLPLSARGQAPDSVQLGERVRVRVAATRGNVNLFVGNVTALSPDTLTLSIPGGKGTIILPRASISEVAISNGHESRWRNLARATPLIIPAVMLATLPRLSGPHSQAMRNKQYGLLALQGVMIGHVMLRPTPERWRPIYSWLDRP